jgi:hypothetical protein
MTLTLRGVTRSVHQRPWRSSSPLSGVSPYTDADTSTTMPSASTQPKVIAGFGSAGFSRGARKPCAERASQWWTRRSISSICASVGRVHGPTALIHAASCAIAIITGQRARPAGYSAGATSRSRRSR